MEIHASNGSSSTAAYMCTQYQPWSLATVRRETVFITVWPWPFDLWVNARRATAIEYMCTKFGTDSSSRCPVRARTDRQTDRQTNLNAVPTPVAMPTWVNINNRFRPYLNKCNAYLTATFSTRGHTDVLPSSSWATSSSTASSVALCTPDITCEPFRDWTCSSVTGPADSWPSCALASWDFPSTDNPEIAHK